MVRFVKKTFCCVDACLRQEEESAEINCSQYVIGNKYYRHEGLASSIFRGDQPYSFCPDSQLIDRLVQRLIEGSPPVLDYFNLSQPPRAVRVGLAMCTAGTGSNWYSLKTLVPQVLIANGPNMDVWDRWLPSPEAFHFDMLPWKETRNVESFVQAILDSSSDDDVLMQKVAIRFDGKRMRQLPVCIRLGDLKSALDMNTQCVPVESLSEMDWDNWPVYRRRIISLCMLTLALAEGSNLWPERKVKSWFDASLSAHDAIVKCRGSIDEVKSLLKSRRSSLQPLEVKSTGLWVHMYPTATSREALLGMVNAIVTDPQNSQFSNKDKSPGILFIASSVGEQIKMKMRYEYGIDGEWTLTEG